MGNMNIISVILGRRCLFCGRTADLRENPFCKRCQEEIVRDNLEISPEETGSVLALYRYSGPVREGLHRFKYRRGRQLGIFLGRTMARRFRDLGRKADLVTCVPRAKDGLPRPYNQSAVLAKAFAKELNLPLNQELLRKRPGAKTQVQCKNSAARRRNARDAYRAGSSQQSIKGLTVALVDDLYTSGATAQVCKSILKRKGAGKVEICTAMITANPPGLLLRLSPQRRHKYEALRPDKIYQHRSFRCSKPITVPILHPKEGCPDCPGKSR